MRFRKGLSLLLVSFLIMNLFLSAGCGSSKTTEEKSSGENTAAAENVPGVTKDSVTFANLNDFTGPLALNGQMLTPAMEALFKYVNMKGGIHGRKLILQNEDTGFDVTKAQALYKKVSGNVFGIVMLMGTGISVSLRDKIAEDKIPSIAAGESDSIYNPPIEYLWTGGTSYYRQAAVVMQQINSLKPKAKVGLINMDDTSGKAYEKAAKIAADYYGIELISAPFKPTDVDFGSQVMIMKQANVDFLLVGGVTTPVAGIIKEAKKQGLKAQLVGAWQPSTVASVVGVAGKEATTGYWGVRSVATWADKDLPGVQEATKVLKEVGMESYIGKQDTFFVGWMNAKIVVKALEDAGPNLTREKFNKAIENLRGYELGGLVGPITYGPDKHISGNAVFIAKGVWEGDTFAIKADSDWIEPEPELLKLVEPK